MGPGLYGGEYGSDGGGGGGGGGVGVGVGDGGGVVVPPGPTAPPTNANGFTSSAPTTLLVTVIPIASAILFTNASVYFSLSLNSAEFPYAQRRRQISLQTSEPRQCGEACVAAQLFGHGSDPTCLQAMFREMIAEYKPANVIRSG